MKNTLNEHICDLCEKRIMLPSGDGQPEGWLTLGTRSTLSTSSTTGVVPTFILHKAGLTGRSMPRWFDKDSSWCSLECFIEHLQRKMS